MLYDPANREQIFAGQLVYRNNRSYFDTWTSFPARSFRNGAPPPSAPIALDDFRIDSSIDENLAMKSVTRATLTLRRKIGLAIALQHLAQDARDRARIDGEPVEVFDRESLRSNLIVGSDNREFLLVTTDSARSRPAARNRSQSRRRGDSKKPAPAFTTSTRAATGIPAPIPISPTMI